MKRSRQNWVFREMPGQELQRLFADQGASMSLFVLQTTPTSIEDFITGWRNADTSFCFTLMDAEQARAFVDYALQFAQQHDMSELHIFTYEDNEDNTSSGSCRRVR